LFDRLAHLDRSDTRDRLKVSAQHFRHATKDLEAIDDAAVGPGLESLLRTLQVLVQVLGGFVRVFGHDCAIRRVQGLCCGIRHE
jgi:hypothetical protein